MVRVRVPGLDIIVRPHGRHLCLERLKREFERRARVPDLELLEHARVQDAQPADLHVHAHTRLAPPRVRSNRRPVTLLLCARRLADRRRTVVNRRRTTREERRVCIKKRKKKKRDGGYQSGSPRCGIARLKKKPLGTYRSVL